MPGLWKKRASIPIFGSSSTARSGRLRARQKTKGLCILAISMPMALRSNPWLRQMALLVQQLAAGKGKIDDRHMLKESRLEEILQEVNSLPDPTCSEGYGHMGPFKTMPSHLVLTPQKAEFNVRMSGACIAVEQLFGLVLNKTAYNAYKYGLRQQSTPVAAFYIVSVLLTNIQTRLEGGNEVSQSFGCTPPPLDNYLRLE
jgi:hypothetical protein